MVVNSDRDGKTRMGTGEPGKPPDGAQEISAAPPTDSVTGSTIIAAGGQQPPTDSSDQIDQVDPFEGAVLLERYAVERKLGEGGMGAVYVARHTALDKRVALKILHAEFARKPDLVERFLLEAKAASRIRHENVIDISDFGKTPDGAVFFAMEYLEGRDLHDLLTRERLSGKSLPWARSREIFLQVCSALASAHDQGIVHRDLKPENIFLVQRLGSSDFVKLLDFGIAKVTEVSDDDSRKLTRTGMLFGTPEYMSPEQARGEKVDHRVDVYAMGCILFQLVTGKVPFESDNFMGILSQHLTKEPPVVTRAQLAAVGAPAAVADIVARALTKDRDIRFQTVTDFARAVADGLGDAPSGRHQTDWRGRARIEASTPVPDIDPPPVESRRRLWGLVMLGAVACIVTIIVFVSQRGAGTQATPNESLAPQDKTMPRAAGVAPVDPQPTQPVATPEVLDSPISGDKGLTGKNVPAAADPRSDSTAAQDKTKSTSDAVTSANKPSRQPPVDRTKPPSSADGSTKKPTSTTPPPEKTAKPDKPDKADKPDVGVDELEPMELKGMPTEEGS